MTSLVAHRIELQPNNTQRTYFAKCCGLARLTWNWALAEWERQYGAGDKPSAMALKRQFNAVKYALFPFIDECSQYPVSQAFFDLSRAWRNFFRSIKAKDGPFGRPKFKSKRGRASCYFANTAFRIEGRRCYIQKLGWVPLREPLRFDGRILGARVSREGRRWYMAIQVEVPYIRHRRRTARRVEPMTGIDLGSAELAVLSDGTSFAAPKSYNRRLKHLADLQAKIRTQTKGSRRNQRLRERIRVLHAKIARERAGVQHRLTAHVTRRYRNLAIQKWDVKSMTQSAKGTVEEPGKNVAVKALFNRHALDAGWYEIRRQLEYKAARRAVNLITLPATVKVTQTCSLCDREQEVTPDMEYWQCLGCGRRHRRKHNTAVNICRWAEGSAVFADGTAA